MPHSVHRSWCHCGLGGAASAKFVALLRSNDEGILIIGDESSIKETEHLIDLISKKESGKLILINNSRKLSSRGRSNKNIFVFEHTTENTYISPIFEIYTLYFLIFQIAKNQGVFE